MRIEQTAEEVSEGRWKWSVWIEGSPDELATVEKVVYHLHPSFARPIVERNNRNDKFRVDATGWGTFVIKIEIHKTNGDTEQRSHRLRFSRSEPKVFVSAASGDTEQVNAVKGVLSNLGIGMLSDQDISPGDDWTSAIRKQIDQSKALILVNGPTPSRWVMQALDTAKALGKHIVCIGESPFYDTGNSTRIASIDQLTDAIGKLPE